MTPQTTFQPLEQHTFQSLRHAAYLKGLLRPFKGKGELETWANDCFDENGGAKLDHGSGGIVWLRAA